MQQRHLLDIVVTCTLKMEKTQTTSDKMERVVLDNGFVKLLETFGDELTIVNAARVSFGVQKSELSKARKPQAALKTGNTCTFTNWRTHARPQI